MGKKLYSAKFRLNSKILALMYICCYYNYPTTVLLTFYETYKDMSLFALKALSTCKKIKLTDNMFVKILQESATLYGQIIKGITIKLKRNQLLSYNPKNEEIPLEPTLDVEVFSDDYKRFITEYLIENVEDLFVPEVKLNISSEDLYSDMIGV